MLASHRIQAQHPDIFILDLLNLNSRAVCQAAARQRSSLKNPPKTVEDYLETLNQQGLTQTVAILKEFFNEI